MQLNMIMKRLLGLEVHRDGFKPTNYLEWRSSIALREIEANVNFLAQLKERLEAS